LIWKNNELSPALLKALLRVGTSWAPNSKCPMPRAPLHRWRLLEAFDLAQRWRHGTMALTTSDAPVTHLQRFVIEKQKRRNQGRGRNLAENP